MPTGSGDGLSRVVFRRPDVSLRAHVLEYCEYVERNDGSTRRLQLPSAGASLIIGFESPVQILMARRQVSAQTFIVGPHDASAETVSHDWHRGVQVDLTAIGARMLLDVPLHHLANRAVALADVLGPRATHLTDALQGLATPEAGFARLDALLANWLAGARPIADSIAMASRRLHETGGRLRVGALADEVELSRQHLSTRFQHEMGLPPKTVARIIRFEAALRLLHSGEAAPPLSDLALTCGYYDQAHFNREFRQLTGVTPTDYLAALRSFQRSRTS